jgi:hypothetical protein
MLRRPPPTNELGPTLWAVPHEVGIGVRSHGRRLSNVISPGVDRHVPQAFHSA